MKIETLDQKWNPIIVTIESYEEAWELYTLIVESDMKVNLWEKLYRMIGDLL